ncbi:MAG: DUF3418 domain-containing protein, partial [bacterium]|nr:DUF3418 domain-containing protein [bacterium]
FDFDEIPKEVEVERGGVTISAFPAIVDDGDSVSIRLFDTRESAQRNLRSGLRRLFAIAEQSSLLSHVKYLPDYNKIELLAGSFTDRNRLRSSLADLIADRAFLSQKGLPRTIGEFQTRLAEGRDRATTAVQEVSKFVGPFFTAHHQVRLACENLSGAKHGAALGDIKQQIKRLMPKDFLLITPWRWLNEFTRFFSAINHRIEKLKSGGESRDRDLMLEMKPWLQTLHEREEAFAERAIFDPELEHFIWMLEEYRVSLFAQPLGTSLKISPQRLEKQWQKVQPLI